MDHDLIGGVPPSSESQWPPIFLKEDRAAVRMFLMGTHPRVGQDSAIQLLPVCSTLSGVTDLVS